MKHLVPSSAALAALLWAGATAASPSPASERAQALIAEGEFERALQAIDEGLTGATDRREVARLCELQGTAHLYLGKEDAARQSFARLVKAVPDWELAKASGSKARALFNSVKAESNPRPTTLKHERIAAAPAGRRLDVPAEITGLPEGARAQVFYRRRGGGSYSSAPLAHARGDLFVAYIPAFAMESASDGFTLEYYLEATDPAGRRLAGMGSDREPATLQVKGGEASPAGPPAPPPAWYRQWWVWTIAGGVAAGATAAVAVPLLIDDQATVQVTVKVLP